MIFCSFERKFLDVRVLSDHPNCGTNVLKPPQMNKCTNLYLILTYWGRVLIPLILTIYGGIGPLYSKLMNKVSQKKAEDKRVQTICQITNHLPAMFKFYSCLGQNCAYIEENLNYLVTLTLCDLLILQIIMELLWPIGFYIWYVIFLFGIKFAIILKINTSRCF